MSPVSDGQRPSPRRGGERRVRLHPQGSPAHAHRLAVSGARAARPHWLDCPRARSARPICSAGRFDRGDLVRVRWAGGALPRRAGVGGGADRRGRRRASIRPLFCPATYRDLDELDGFLEYLAGEVYDRAVSRAARSVAWRSRVARRVAPRALLACRASRVPGRAARAHRRGGNAGARDVCQLHPRLNSDLLLTAALGPRPRAHARVHLRRRDRAERGGPLARPSGARASRCSARRAGALDEERRLALLHCVLCHHGPASAPGGRFGSAEAVALYRLNALDAGVKGVLEHGTGAAAAGSAAPAGGAAPARGAGARAIGAAAA